jgi:hypothetical protein
MVVLGTTTHEFACRNFAFALRNSWMVGPSPTMTVRGMQRASMLPHLLTEKAAANASCG